MNIKAQARFHGKKANIKVVGVGGLGRGHRGEARHQVGRGGGPDVQAVGPGAAAPRASRQAATPLRQAPIFFGSARKFGAILARCGAMALMNSSAGWRT